MLTPFYQPKVVEEVVVVEEAVVVKPPRGRKSKRVATEEVRTIVTSL
jgi:hypothetical protein